MGVYGEVEKWSEKLSDVFDILYNLLNIYCKYIERERGMDIKLFVLASFGAYDGFMGVHLP